MALITYADKSALNENAEVANNVKVTADDMNEIKEVVNGNANELDDVSANKIIETGSNDNGTWRKYANGDMECWFRQKVDVSINSQWGGLYVGTTSLHNFPQTFIDLPVVLLDIETEGGWQALAGRPSANGKTTTSNPGDISFFRGTSCGLVSFTVNVYAKGKWE